MQLATKTINMAAILLDASGRIQTEAYSTRLEYPGQQIHSGNRRRLGQ